MLKKQVTEIDSESDVLPRTKRADVLIDGKLRSKTHGVVAVDSQHGRPKENLTGLRLWDGHTRLDELIGTFTDQFTEDAPVPLIGRSAPLRWAVAVDQTVVQHVGTLIAVVLEELRERSTQPDIVAA